MEKKSGERAKPGNYWWKLIPGRSGQPETDDLRPRQRRGEGAKSSYVTGLVLY
jgi:hypothetical protein